MTTTDLPASLIPTLAGHYYTDPAIFALEQSRIFEQMWFCAVRSADLAPGSFRRVQVGRESVLVVRGRDGQLRSFLNVCRHRGSTLAAADSGEVKRSIQCPYHAWTYGLDGKLVAAPNLTTMPDIDRERVRTAAGSPARVARLRLGLPCRRAAVLRGGRHRCRRRAARVRRPRSTATDLDALSVGRRIRYDVKANWKLIIENFMECYHCATIHPELTEVLPEFADGYAAQYFVGHGAEFGADIAGLHRRRQRRLRPAARRRRATRTGATTRSRSSRTVFVNLVPDHVILHRMYPIAEDLTIVECDWLYSRDVVESGKDVSRSVELFHRVNQQDFDACERCQPAMSSRGYHAAESWSLPSTTSGSSTRG